VAFVIIVVGVSLAVGVVASILRTVLGLLFLGWLDHLLGAALGILQMLLLLSVITIVATVFPVPGLSDAINNSALAPTLARPLSFIVDWLPPEFGVVRYLLNWNQ
jgi:membrane protein required for colicin V production